MDKVKNIDVSDLSVVEATQKFIDKYYDDSTVYININSSQVSKSKDNEKGYYKIELSSEVNDNKIPGFFSVDNYSTMLKQDFTEWLGISVKYFYVEWNMSLGRNEEYEFAPSLSLVIELRV